MVPATSSDDGRRYLLARNRFEMGNLMKAVKSASPGATLVMILVDQLEEKEEGGYIYFKV